MFTKKTRKQIAEGRALPPSDIKSPCRLEPSWKSKTTPRTKIPTQPGSTHSRPTIGSNTPIATQSKPQPSITRPSVPQDSNSQTENSIQSQISKHLKFTEIPSKIEFSSHGSNSSHRSYKTTWSNSKHGAVRTKPPEKPTQSKKPPPGEATPPTSNFQQNFGDISYSPTSDEISILSPGPDFYAFGNGLRVISLF